MKKSKYLFPFMASFVFVSVFLFAEIHSGSGYEVDYLNWFKSDYPGYDLLVLIPKNTAGTYHENISIILTPDSNSSVTDWDAIKKAQIDELKKIIDDFQLVSFKPAALGGVDSRVIEYTGKYSGMSLRWIQYYTLKDGNWYTLSYVGEGKDQKENLAEALKIIDSFTFK